ncbi:BnaA05g12130D [Brassica napus]|uniref:BnaA05g12130D protein n=1 Tax=Brassica napus TaxID=3708 RepID=A0A078FF54_BRANA|nr:BnaA05g12130D [Brassica napus]
MEGKPEVIGDTRRRLCSHVYFLLAADKKQYGELYAIFKEIQGLLRHGVAVVKISTQFSLWSSALLNFFLHSQTDTYFCGSSCFSILTLMILLSYPRFRRESF